MCCGGRGHTGLERLALLAPGKACLRWPADHLCVCVCVCVRVKVLLIALFFSCCRCAGAFIDLLWLLTVISQFRRIGMHRCLVVYVYSTRTISYYHVLGFPYSSESFAAWCCRFFRGVEDLRVSRAGGSGMAVLYCRPGLVQCSGFGTSSVSVAPSGAFGQRAMAKLMTND